MALKKEQLFALILFLSLGFLVSKAHGAPAPASAQNNSLNLLQGQVKEQGAKVSKLKNEIHELENNLNNGNKKYLSIVKSSQELEEKIYQLRSELQKTQQELAVKREAAERVLTKSLLVQLDREQDPAQLLSQKILMEVLVKELQTIDQDLKKNNEQLAQLESFQTKYEEFATTQRELATFLNELEQKKGSIVDHYMSEVERQKEVEARFSKVKTQFALAQARAQKNERVTDLRFINPLSDFEKIEHDDKGLTLTYSGRKPVTSAQKGEVVYSGELSTYGNVVMIDHGDETRSIVLGDFIPMAKKGAVVNTGDILGYTAYNPRANKESGKVYFEVRKKNIVQNTIQLMDARSLDSGVLAAR